MSPLSQALLKPVRFRIKRYALNDTFTTAEAAPLASPRTCEPGPGTLTFTDTANKFSISGGNFVVNAGVLNTSNMVAASQANRVGEAFKIRAAVTGDASRVGFTVGPSLGNAGTMLLYGANAMILYTINSGLTIPRAFSPYPIPDTVSFYAAREAVIVRCGSRTLFIVSNTAFDTYYLLGAIPNTDQFNAVPAFICHTNNNGATVNFIRVGFLTSPYTSDFGIAHQRIDAVSAGNTIDMPAANAFVEFSWTAVTGEVCDLMVRWTDDDNCWIIRLNQATSTVKIIQKEGGTETERASAAATFANGTTYEYCVLCVGSTIRATIHRTGGNHVAYTSATFNNTATGVKVDKAGANLVTWPYQLSGRALEVIKAL